MKKVVCRQDQERDIHYTTIHNTPSMVNIILDSNFKNYILDSMFSTSLCIMGELKLVVSLSQKNFICKQIMYLCFNFSHRRTNLVRTKYVLSSVRKLKAIHET